MAKFADIELFPRAAYEIDVSWHYLETHITESIRYGLNLEPDFQRAHVWTRTQQIAYIEYVIRGGEVGKNLTFNCPTWNHALERDNDYVIVDGKQRLQAARDFMHDKIPAFGYLRSEYTDLMRMHIGFKWRVCTLQTRRELLQLYLNINAGGTPHTKEELDKVRAMLETEL